MGTINRFEDIKAWQKARDLVKTIYRTTGDHQGFSKDFALKDQIRRASLSVMSNIAEGFARRTDKEFARFLYIALGSAAEVQSQIYVALDLGYVTEREFKEIYESTSETARLINGFLQYLTADRRLPTADCTILTADSRLST
jgi:four helix bundle protein